MCDAFTHAVRWWRVQVIRCTPNSSAVNKMLYFLILHHPSSTSVTFTATDKSAMRIIHTMNMHLKNCCKVLKWICYQITSIQIAYSKTKKKNLLRLDYILSEISTNDNILWRRSRDEPVERATEYKKKINNIAIICRMSLVPLRSMHFACSGVEASLIFAVVFKSGCSLRWCKMPHILPASKLHFFFARITFHNSVCLSFGSSAAYNMWDFVDDDNDKISLHIVWNTMTVVRVCLGKKNTKYIHLNLEIVDFKLTTG